MFYRFHLSNLGPWTDYFNWNFVASF